LVSSGVRLSNDRVAVLPRRNAAYQAVAVSAAKDPHGRRRKHCRQPRAGPRHCSRKGRAGVPVVLAPAVRCPAAVAADQSTRGRNRLTSRGFVGSGFHAAIVLAHSRASAMSVTPGKSRQSSTAADNSPPRSKAARIASASASDTTNILRGWTREPRSASGSIALDCTREQLQRARRWRLWAH
jgi:hypothetical protein